MLQPIIKRSEESFLDSNAYMSKLKGKILHQTLYFIDFFEDFEKLDIFIKKALLLQRSNPKMWNLKTDFLHPLNSILQIPNIQEVFPPKNQKVLIYKEKEILIPTREKRNWTIRPDRIILTQAKAHVVDFKTDKSEEFYLNYVNQIKTYAKIIKRTFNLKTKGSILFIASPLLEEVCEV